MATMKLRDRQLGMGLYDFRCGSRKVGSAMYFKQPRTYDVYATVGGRQFHSKTSSYRAAIASIREAAGTIPCASRKR